MKSPYKYGWGAYEDSFNKRQVPEEEALLISQGYKFLGWQVSSDTVKEFKECIDHGHNYASVFPGVWKNVQHNPRGSNCTYWCTKCRIYWKIDMSD